MTKSSILAIAISLQTIGVAVLSIGFAASEVQGTPMAMTEGCGCACNNPNNSAGCAMLPAVPGPLPAACPTSACYCGSMGGEFVCNAGNYTSLPPGEGN